MSTRNFSVTNLFLIVIVLLLGGGVLLWMYLVLQHSKTELSDVVGTEIAGTFVSPLGLLQEGVIGTNFGESIDGVGPEIHVLQPGLTGATGAIGAIGATGTSGATGTGTLGPQGLIGVTGPTGATGPGGVSSVSGGAGLEIAGTPASPIIEISESASDGLLITSGVLGINVTGAKGLWLNNDVLNVLTGNGLGFSGNNLVAKTADATVTVGASGIAVGTIDDSNIDFGTGVGEVSADDILIVDAVDFYTTNNVEAALAQIQGADITAVTTAAGTGLTGGLSSGSAALSLLTSCASNEILKWNGAGWACAADISSSGAVMSVGAGDGLSNSGTATDPVLDIDYGLGVSQVSADNIPIADGTAYYTTDDVEAALTQLATSKQETLGFTPENVANKSTDVYLGADTPSDTLYPTEKAVKAYADNLVLGLSWQNPLELINVVADSAGPPPACPVGNYDAYLINTGGNVGAWAAFLPGDMVQCQSGTWVLIKAMVVGDRFGVGFITATVPSGGMTGKSNNLVQITGGVAGAYTYTFVAPSDNDALYVTNTNAYYSNMAFLYAGALAKWIQFSANIAYNFGSGIRLVGTTASLWDLTTDWIQSGAYDIVLNNALSEFKMLESAGGAFYGTLDVGDLSGNKTYTFPNISGATGTVCVSGGSCTAPGDITLTVAPSADALSTTTSSGSGLEVVASGLTLLQGCADTQILKWDEANDIWACAADATGSSTLQTTYDNDADSGDVTVAYTTADDSIVFQNPAASGTDSAFIFNIDQLAGSSKTGLLISSAASGMTDAIDASDPDISNAINIGANTITGSTGIIDFTNFDVASSGAITLTNVTTDITTGANEHLNIAPNGSGDVTIGTADTVGTVLVLDEKNDAGDPPGSDGSMYYNSNYGKFRCLENSAWKDCASLSVLTDNVTDAFDLQEGVNNYININTTNAAENISFGNATTNPSFTFIGSGTITFTGGVKIGNSGTTITNHLSNTASLDFPSLAHDCGSLTLTVTGAVAGDSVVATPTPVAGGIETLKMSWNAYVSSADTVTIRVCSVSPTASNAAAQTWRADVWKH